MGPDKDKPWTWVKYREGLCQGCHGGCCTMPVEVRGEDLIRLNLTDADQLAKGPRKVARQLMRDGFVSSYREGTGFFMLTQKPNGDCHFLDSKSRLCTVYDQRPDVCREFPAIGPRPGFCPARKSSRQ